MSAVDVRIAGPDDLPALAALRAQWDADAPQEPGFAQRLADWLEAEGDRRRARQRHEEREQETKPEPRLNDRTHSCVR